jgi:HEPN domain-containing protein
MPAKIIQTAMSFSVFSLEADRDYLLSRWINFAGAGFHSRAGFFAQQACEKYLKALNVQKDGGYFETHNLKELAAACEAYDPYFSSTETLRILERFDLFDQIGRYGGAAKFDPLSKGKSVGGQSIQVDPGLQIAGASMWSDEHLDDLDGFVFKTRSFLDFSKIKYDDNLKSVLERNGKNILVSLWQGHPPIRIVLTKKNRYFKA